MGETLPAAVQSVLVLGGGGFYGRYVVADLLQFSSCRVVVAERRPPPAWDGNPRIRTAVCDVHDRESLRPLVAASSVVVHCAGPFQLLPLAPAEIAIECGTPYVDVSEDLLFRRRILELDPAARAAGIPIVSGASVVPGMQALLVELVRPEFDELTGVRTFAAPDVKRHRGPAMFYTMLLGAGRAFRLPRQGEWVEVHGWTEPEWVQFPLPVGRRLVYLVLEMAELDLLPSLFGVSSVEFKAGCEFPLLNRMLGLLTLMRMQTGHPQLERWTSAVRAGCWLLGRLGREEDGFIVEVTGRRAGKECRHAVAAVAAAEGGRIPALLASMVAQVILAGRLTGTGVLSPLDWMTPADLVRGFRARGLEILERWESEPWRPLAMEKSHV